MGREGRKGKVRRDERRDNPWDREIQEFMHTPLPLLRFTTYMSSPNSHALKTLPESGCLFKRWSLVEGS